METERSDWFAPWLPKQLIGLPHGCPSGYSSRAGEWRLRVGAGPDIMVRGGWVPDNMAEVLMEIPRWRQNGGYEENSRKAGGVTTWVVGDGTGTNRFRTSFST